MRFRLTHAVLALLLMLGQGAAARAQYLSSEQLGPEVTNAEEGFSIRPPAGWQPATPPTPDMKALFLGPRKDAAGPTAAVWVDMDAGSLLDFIGKLRFHYERTRQDNEIVRINVAFTKNQPQQAFVEWAYTQQNIRVRALQFMLASGDRKYTAECTAPAEGFEAYVRLFEAVLSTFRLSGATGEKAIAAFRMRPDGSYLNTRHNFSILPPSGWKADHSGRSGVVAFSSPVVPNGPAPGVISVVCRNSNMILPLYVDHFKQVASATLPGYRTISDIKTAIGGRDAYQITFCFNQIVDKKVIAWRNLKVIMADGDSKYEITSGTLDTVFAQYEKVFEETSKTFRIEKTTDEDK